MSTTLSRGALAAAALTSAIALGDAVWQATADEPAPWTPGEGTEWVWRVGEASHGLTYALLAAVLWQFGARIDAGRAAVRWVRRVLAVVLALLGAGFLASAAVELGSEGPVGAVVGVAFLALFPLAVALGGVLVARRETRSPAAWLLVAVVPLLGLTVLASAVGWGHPAYVETAVYLGLALLGFVAGSAENRVAEPALSGRSR